MVDLGVSFMCAFDWAVMYPLVLFHWRTQASRDFGIESDSRGTEYEG